MARNQKLPEEVYVYWNDSGGGEPFLSVGRTANELVDELGQSILVGRYVIEGSMKVETVVSITPSGVAEFHDPSAAANRPGKKIRG